MVHAGLCWCCRQTWSFQCICQACGEAALAEYQLVLLEINKENQCREAGVQCPRDSGGTDGHIEFLSNQEPFMSEALLLNRGITVLELRAKILPEVHGTTRQAQLELAHFWKTRTDTCLRARTGLFGRSHCARRCRNGEPSITSTSRKPGEQDAPR